MANPANETSINSVEIETNPSRLTPEGLGHSNGTRVIYIYNMIYIYILIVYINIIDSQFNGDTL